MVSPDLRMLLLYTICLLTPVMYRHTTTEFSKPVTVVGCPYTNILTLVQHINLAGFIHVKMAASAPAVELVAKSA